MTARVYSVASLAAHWECGPDTIYALIHGGQLSAFRLGGKLLRIRGDEVDRYECRMTTASNDTGESLPSSGTINTDAIDIRLERLIEHPQRPQLVHSGNGGGAR